MLTANALGYEGDFHSGLALDEIKRERASHKVTCSANGRLTR